MPTDANAYSRRPCLQLLAAICLLATLSCREETATRDPSALASAGTSADGAAPRQNALAARACGAIRAASEDPSSQSQDPATDCAKQPIGFWKLDDCDEARTELVDASFRGHTAFRALTQACTDGTQGRAVAFQYENDVVRVLDQEDYALDAGMTLAAWVRPTVIDGVRTLFRKGDAEDGAVTLAIRAGTLELRLRLTSGQSISLAHPIEAERWTHVAATYDNNFARLYVDGHEVAHIQRKGKIAQSAGPLLIGSDGAGKAFSGVMDNIWFNTLATPDTTVAELSCSPKAPSVSVSPAPGTAAAPGDKINYTLTIENNDDSRCAAASYAVLVALPTLNFQSDPPLASTGALASGERAELSFVIRSPDQTDPGSYPIDFQVLVPQREAGTNHALTPSSFAGATEATAEAAIIASTRYVVPEPAGCYVSPDRELMIRDLSVVEDPVRTAAVGGRFGAWTFGRLMQSMSPSDADAPDITEAMFRSFLMPQTLNGFVIEPRPSLDEQLLKPWPRTPDGKLDLARAPLRLLAITHRMDLLDLEHGKAGEGRLTFGGVDAAGDPRLFTLIFEYALPAKTAAEADDWAQAVHALQREPFPSESYNRALQALTDRFAARGADPKRPNGSALLDIRTNELAFATDNLWQMREFRISAQTGRLEAGTLAQTPDARFNESAELGRFINENADKILAQTHTTPGSFEDSPFQAASVLNALDVWDAPDIRDPELRHNFSLNTCDGCHGGETVTAFMHLTPRHVGEQSPLSVYLSGESVADAISLEPRWFNELANRRAKLEAVVCAAGKK